MNKKANKKNLAGRFLVAGFFVLLFSFSLLMASPAKALINTYNKVNGSQLTPQEWNNLLLDFLNTDGGRVNGSIGINTATSSSYILNVSGGGYFSQPVVVGTPSDVSHAATMGYVNSVITGGAGSTVGYWAMDGININNTNTGNVGIGTTNPLTSLQIGPLSGGPTATPAAISLGGSYSNTPGANAKFRMYDIGDGVTSTYGLGVSAAQFEFLTASDAHYSWFIGGTEKMRLANNGSVGIGTTNPVAKLDVNGKFNVLSTGTAGNLNIGGVSILGSSVDPGESRILDITDNTKLVISSDKLFNNNPGSEIGFSGRYRSDAQYQLMFGSIGAFKSNTDDFDGTGFLSFKTTTGYGGLAEKMRIQSNGNVGVGNTAPGTKLDVTGSFRNSLATTHTLLGNSGNVVVMADNTGALYSTPLPTFVSANSLWEGSKNGNIWNGDAGAGNVGIGTTNPTSKVSIHNVGGTDSVSILSMSEDDNKEFEFQGLFAGTGATGNKLKLRSLWTDNILVVQGDGNVGIGTTGPNYKLDVNGTIGINADDTGKGIIAYSGSNQMFSLTRQPVTNNGTLSITSYSDMGFAANKPTASTAYDMIIQNGNVGIGITDPGTKLDISGSLRNSLATTHSLLGSAGNVVVMADNTGTLYSTPLPTFVSANSLWAGSKNGDIWNGDAGAGNVGIGTTNPGEKLVISGEVHPSLKIISSTDANYNVELQALWDSGHQMSLTVQGTEILGRYTGNTALMTGNVGIGTTAPLAKMHIVGDEILNTYNSTIYFGAWNDAGTEKAIVAGYPSKISGGSLYKGQYANPGDTISWYPMVILGQGSGKDGNVGVGLTDPGTKLDVSGSLRNSLATTHSLLGAAGNVVVMSDNTGTLYSTPLATFASTNSLWGGTKNGNIWNGDAGVGNVGIGTTNPGAQLTIYETSGIKPALTLGYATGYDYSLSRNGATGFLDFSGSQTGAVGYTFSGGNVGIGTTGPNTKLEVSGLVDTNIETRITSSGTGGSYLQLVTAGSGAQIHAKANGDFSLSSINVAADVFNMIHTGAVSNTMTLKTGNVGIGTTAPYTSLDVKRTNDVPFGGTGYRVSTFSSTAAVNSDLPGIHLGYDTTGGGIIAPATQTGTTNFLGFWTYNGGWGERVRITKDGSVGIGITDPGTKLDVSGSSRNSLATTHSLLGNAGNTVVMADNTGTLYNTPLSTFASTNSLWGGTKNGNIWNGDAGVGNVGIGTTNPDSSLTITKDSTHNSGTGNALMINSSVTPTKRLNFGVSSSANYAYIDAINYSISNTNLPIVLQPDGGNVGINTTTPAYKLDVNGTFEATTNSSSIILDASGNVLIGI